MTSTDVLENTNGDTKMGYTTIKHSGGSYQNFWPDNDENTLYIEAHYRGIEFEQIIESIKAHFGENSKLEDFTIEAEHVHTECLGYDSYCSGDHTNFLCIQKIKS